MKVMKEEEEKKEREEKERDTIAWRQEKRGNHESSCKDERMRANTRICSLLHMKIPGMCKFLQDQGAGFAAHTQWNARR